jgi:dihydroflavonol-4-reductase
VKRVLVIGASGFIGLNVVDALIERGFAVRATRRRSTATMFLRRRGVELVDGSLEEPAKLRAAAEGCHAVILTGAHYPRYSLDRDEAVAVGVRGVRNACSAALDAGVDRMVFTSSVGALGRAPAGRPADERDIPRTMPEGSVYRAVKWAMEREVDRYVHRGLPAVTLLPGGCIGPWDLRLGTGAVLVGVVRRAMPWWTDGVANLVDVGDVARAHVAALDATPGARFCVAGHTVGVARLLEMIVARYGGALPVERLTNDEARQRADRDEREAAPKNGRVPVPRELVDLVTSGQVVSSARARRDLGVDFTSLEAALDRAHAWFVRFHYLPRPALNERSPHDYV